MKKVRRSEENFKEFHDFFKDSEEGSKRRLMKTFKDSDDKFRRFNENIQKIGGCSFQKMS